MSSATHNFREKLRGFDFYFFLVGTFLGVLIASGIFLKTVLFLRASEKTDGIVSEIVRTADFENGEMFQAVFEFEDKQGNWHRLHDQARFNPSPYQVDQEVSILYDPAAPQSGRVNSFFNVWWESLIAILITLGFSVGFLFNIRHRFL